jgi:hypothetical protein
MCRIDNGVNLVVSDVARQTFGAAKSADAQRDRRSCGVCRGTSKRKDRREVGRARDAPSQRARFGRAPKNEQAQALQGAAP